MVFRRDAAIVLCVVIGEACVSTFTMGPVVCADVPTYVMTKSFFVGAFSNRITGSMSIHHNFSGKTVFRTGPMAGF